MANIALITNNILSDSGIPVTASTSGVNGTSGTSGSSGATSLYSGTSTTSQTLPPSSVSYYSWYLRGTNTVSDPCPIMTSIAPVYTSVPALANGVTIYSNTGLTTPYSGFAYISNSLTKWTMSTGVLTSGVSC